MGLYRITCVSKDQNGVIYEVGLNDGGRYSVRQIVTWIDGNVHRFETTTPDGRYVVPVYAPERNGTRYLTTSPDGRLPNNLDYLRQC